jgi:ABC-2 type transport system ATP-binding protein
LIEIKGISKSYRTLQAPALSDVSFEVGKGEIFGIVGPDGAGKSTLLRILAGILHPGAGSVIMNGKDLFKNIYDVKDNLAYMPQKFGLYEDLTVEENIFFFGNLFGMSNREIRANLGVLYSFSRLEPFKNRLSGKLSGGMKQKLGLACCLVHNPDIILLDEPTNGVDPVSRREFWKILYDLLSEGKTIVISTAYLDEAERANRMALMHRGKIIALGTPGEIKKLIPLKFLEVIVSDPRKAERVLKAYNEFKSVILTGSTLKIFLPGDAVSEEKLKAVLGKDGIKIVSIRANIPGLEDCFVEILAMRQAS